MTSFHAIFLATLLPLVTATIFTSSYKMRKMALQEDKILSILKTYIDEQQDLPKKVSYGYQRLLEESKQKPAPDVANDLKHPNGAYYFIKRFSVRYPKLLGASLDLVIQRLRLKKDPITIPDKEDLEGALTALIRLQEIYNLSTSDMIEGNYRGHVGPALGYEDVYYVGRVAFSKSKLNISLDWLGRSLELRRKDAVVAAKPRQKPTIGSIKALIARGHIMLGNLKQAEELYSEVNKEDRKGGDAELLAKELKNPKIIELPQLTHWQVNYSRLCQYKGPYHIESPDYKAMKCRYKAALVPYYVFKEEILSLSPYVSLFYNVFTDHDRTHLTKNVYDKLDRGKVLSENKEDPLRSDSRTCDVAWMRDAQSFYTTWLSKRVSLITGLSIHSYPGTRAVDYPQSGESFQIVNYGLAGHYDTHFDTRDTPDASGFRIATFLIYLNSVDEGGNTVFTKAGISVAAEKNTVLFWYNLPPSLDKVDDYTEHAGCPVVIGEKWIANKWIRSHGNDYSRPCGLKSDDTQMDVEKIMTHRQRTIFKK